MTCQPSKGLGKLSTAQLEKYFTKNIAILSAGVDPRYHDLDFLRSEQREEVARILLERIKRMEKECQQAEKATGELTVEPRAKSLCQELL